MAKTSDTIKLLKNKVPTDQPAAPEPAAAPDTAVAEPARFRSLVACEDKAADIAEILHSLAGAVTALADFDAAAHEPSGAVGLGLLVRQQSEALLHLRDKIEQARMAAEKAVAA